MQLNKYLAVCGAASRRKANDLIDQGRVKVNGEIVRERGRTVQEGEDIVELDTERLTIPATLHYVLLNKPASVITAVTDPHGRRTVIDLVESEERIFPVGRLDYDTEGVLILTNDGSLTYRLTHPKYGVEKVYEAWVEGLVAPDALVAIERGVPLNGDVRVSGKARIIRKESARTLIEIRIHEGKKRQIKRMMKFVGHPVLKLRRTRFAGIGCGDLGVGDWRELSEEEVVHLYNAVGLTKEKQAGSGIDEGMNG